MTIKVQCGCGARYAFDVEPQGGVMPFRVNCPTCGADGTDAANEVIAQSPEAQQQAAQPKLRMAAPAVPIPAAVPLPPPNRPAVGSSIQRLQAEAKQMRRVGWIIAAVLLVVVGLIGVWFWYVAFGTKPKLVFLMKLDPSEIEWRTEFLDGGKLLLASPSHVILRDLRTQSDIWSATLPGQGGGEGRPPDVLIDKADIWVCGGRQVTRLDRQNGEIKQTVPITGQFSSFTPTPSGILVVSATSETRRTVLTIDRGTDEVSRRDIEVPRAQQHAMPDELPPNVEPTAGVLLAQATEDQKFNKPLNAVSSEFFSAGQNLVELRVKLLEPKVTWVKSIKPRGPSLINGNTTASTSTTGVEEEVFNDIKRDQTGGVKSIDESLYEVRLRRWVGDSPVEWKGNVTGVPCFFSLQTVDLVVAGKSLSVFDKQNNKLFDATLSYPISDRFTGENYDHSAPAVERDGALYFFDQGVLTAMTLPGGQVQWRLTSIGISRVQFDSKGMLYIDTTAAAPEDIQYSDQIKFEHTPAVIMKVDPHSGKILWQTQDKGQRVFLTGKYLYTASAERGGIAMANGLAEALNAPRPDVPTHFHIYRLDPETGGVLWMFYRQEAPDEEVFQNNWFALRFGNDLQVWKYLDF